MFVPLSVAILFTHAHHFLLYFCTVWGLAFGSLICRKMHTKGIAMCSCCMSIFVLFVNKRGANIVTASIG